MNSDEDARLYRLERKVDFLFRRMGIDPEAALTGDTDLPSSFHEALSRNKKIEAIRIYRQSTGAGLKDARDAVEAMARQARW